jgi:hypothetical protein
VRDLAGSVYGRRMYEVMRYGLSHADNRHPFAQRLMQNCAEPRTVIRVKPNVAVDDDHHGQSPNFFKNREQKRQLPLVEGAGLICCRNALARS